MNANDKATIRTAVRQLGGRQLAAIENFIAYVKERTGCTDEQAANVYNLYRREKLVKVDSYMGTWSIKHGAFLDVEVLRRAANLA